MVSKVWDDPTVYSIQVELPDSPLRNLNVYVICTPERNLVIDTGFNREECRQSLWDGIQELGLDLSKTALFLTHIHSDHTGLVWSFLDQGVPVYMGRVEYAYYQKLQTNMPSLETRFRQEGYPMEELARQQMEN